jgi:hypothetical protein
MDNKGAKLMRVRFWCDSGANIHSIRSETLDIQKDLGFTPEEWKAMSDKEKFEEAEIWAWDRLDMGYEEIDGEDDE